MLRPPGVEESFQENHQKVRLTRARYDYDVSVSKISTPRFLNTLIPVEYYITVKIYRNGLQPLKTFVEASVGHTVIFLSTTPLIHLSWPLS